MSSRTPPIPVTAFLPSFYEVTGHRALHPSELTSHSCFILFVQDRMFWINMLPYLTVFQQHLALYERRLDR